SLTAERERGIIHTAYTISAACIGGLSEGVREETRVSWRPPAPWETGLSLYGALSQAVGSGGERFLDTEEVTGSNPVPPISLPSYCDVSSPTNRFLRVLAAPRSDRSGATMQPSPLSFGQTECCVRTAGLPACRVEWLEVGRDECRSDETRKLPDFVLNTHE